MNTIELCVFDMAGTTIDEGNLVYKTVRDAINTRGYDVSLASCLEHGGGKEKRQAIHDVLAGESAIDPEQLDDESDVIFADFKERLAQGYDGNSVRAFSGIEDLFVRLRDNGIKVFLNTGYNRITAEKILGIVGWQVGRDIDGLVTADDVDNGRPAADMILLAMDMAGVSDAQKVLKAGDSVIDIEEGQNAGCGLSIGVLTGAQDEAQLRRAQPDYVLEKLTDLANILL
ncbi:phosphonatase-like hydrolase [Cardiobacteriaceae bacterium TAE3-ERU3]|nr:phosphonatase-like hydrolase [Cardiobacteriaceae bacterium TAE3-ERU3]